MSDRVTLEPAADDYGRRCRSIGLERRNVADLQDVMNHPAFKAEHHALLDRLVKEYRASRPLIERRPLCTIRLGVWKSKEEMIAAVKAGGHKISDWAEEIINQKDFVLLGEPGEYEFFETTVQEIAGENRVTTDELYAKQARLGFCVAPHESACAIRLAFTDQPMDNWRYVLSEPVADASGILFVLDVVRDSDGSWVFRSYANPGDVWDGRGRLLVCRKK